jgi:selenoprotein W-related protein
MAKLAIEYCVECMFLGRALEVAGSLLEQFAQQIDSLELIPGTHGAFTVTLDGEPIYRIGPEGRPPTPEEISRRVGERLQRPA